MFRGIHTPLGSVFFVVCSCPDSVHNIPAEWERRLAAGSVQELEGTVVAAVSVSAAVAVCCLGMRRTRK